MNAKKMLTQLRQSRRDGGANWNNIFGAAAGNAYIPASADSKY